MVDIGNGNMPGEDKWKHNSDSRNENTEGRVNRKNENTQIDGKLVLIDEKDTKQEYTILKQIGNGGVGEVYLASKTADNGLYPKEIAVKIIRESQRFDNETRAMEQLKDNPFIVKIYGMGNLGKEAIKYIAMEYFPEGSLRKYVHANNFWDFPKIATVTLNISKALEAIHEKGMIHRDIKPENILVKLTQGKISTKIGDFGLVKGKHLNGATEKDRVAGTLNYMAPEQFRQDENLDGRVDIFALGQILLEMLKLPGNKPPKELRLIAEKATEQKEKRYKAASEFTTDLDLYLSKKPLKYAIDRDDEIKILNSFESWSFSSFVILLVATIFNPQIYNVESPDEKYPPFLIFYVTITVQGYLYVTYGIKDMKLLTNKADLAPNRVIIIATPVICSLAVLIQFSALVYFLPKLKIHFFSILLLISASINFFMALAGNFQVGKYLRDKKYDSEYADKFSGLFGKGFLLRTSLAVTAVSAWTVLSFFYSERLLFLSILYFVIIFCFEYFVYKSRQEFYKFAEEKTYP